MARAMHQAFKAAGSEVYFRLPPTLMQQNDLPLRLSYQIDIKGDEVVWNSNG
jgi:hypothetical protein